MPNDLNKWNSPAISSEVAQGLVECRIAMHQLFAMIIALRDGQPEALAQAAEKYKAIDLDLQKVINRVGGLDGPK